MTPTDFADLLFGETRTMIDRAKASILAEVRALVADIPAGKDGRDGVDGKDGPMGLTGAVGEKGDTGERGEKGDPGEPGAAGRDGVDGKDGAPGADGKDGRDGVDGKDGAAGRDGTDGKSVTLDEVAPFLDAAVERRMAALVLPPGRKGEKGADGRDGRDGKDGRDGIATRDELIALVREAVTLAVPDAVERAIGEAIKSVPRMEYHGVWTERAFTKGDTVTFGGSLWICRVEHTTGKPGMCDDWQLAVKRGRDAR